MGLFDIGWWWRRMRKDGARNVDPERRKTVIGEAKLSPNGLSERNILGLSVRVASSVSSGAMIAGHVFSDYRAACDGTVQGLEGYAVTSHPSGDTAGALGIVGNVEHAGAGTVARAIGVGGGPFLSGSGTITEALGYGCAAGNKKVAGATGTIGTYKGVWVGDLSTTGAARAFAIDCENSVRADYSDATDDTRLLVWDVTAGQLKRVKRGPPNSGPGGIGRALYIDN